MSSLSSILRETEKEGITSTQEGIRYHLAMKNEQHKREEIGGFDRIQHTAEEIRLAAAHGEGKQNKSSIGGSADSPKIVRKNDTG